MVRMLRVDHQIGGYCCAFTHVEVVQCTDLYVLCSAFTAAVDQFLGWVLSGRARRRPSRTTVSHAWGWLGIYLGSVAMIYHCTERDSDRRPMRTKVITEYRVNR
ncbi:hypothetical protein B0H66DRAFT_561623 [Apodospora peruviana]|uniref:Uncharacterized protein n=1 Tax=Apodospora peruviana TaxID=516989 RepID=A0AAE0I145_9PEZI|nr:hypothetical protein B0H66DRAFT_561623 [Apodospora peruviana]